MTFPILGVAHGPAEIVGRTERGDFMPPACVCVCVCTHTQSCLTLCDPMNCSPPGSSVHGISQVKILEGVAISYAWVSSRPRNRTCISCIGRWILHHHATWEAHATRPPPFPFAQMQDIPDFPGGSVIENLPATQETWVASLGWEDPLEKEMATHSIILT